MKNWILLTIALACFSCQTTRATAEKKVALESKIVGNWEHVSLEVNLPTFNNSDTTEMLVVGKGQWESKLGQRPMKSVFRANNTYELQYYTITDSLFQVDRGVWNSFGDTLMMIEPNNTYQYVVRMKDKYAEFKALVDFDGDGKEDDSYSSIQMKVE